MEPRRLACRALARWVSSALDEKPGETVGYCVRREQVCSERTEVLYVTPGVARRFLSEGQLQDFAFVIFDEFHERGWESDTVMAILAARGERAPRLVLMSATLEAGRIAQVYRARTLESVGRSFPVEIRYQPESGVVAPTGQNLTERAARAVRSAWTGAGRMLVFLPGIAAMQELKSQLSGLPVGLLHGTFTRQRQDRAFTGDESAIILATNVAESSLTVPGVTAVIDSGLEKRAIHQSGYVALATVAISQASADQRAGRAGRTAPGLCLRLWDGKARLESARPPDLERMELDDLLLFLAGLPDGLDTKCEWLDPPPNFASERARERLLQKGLISEVGRLTELGKAAEKLPVEAAWARILALTPVSLRSDLCDLHAFSAARRSWISPHSDSDHAERRRLDFGEEPWARALIMLRHGDPSSHGLDMETLQEARTLSSELRELLGGQERSTESRPHPELKDFLAQHWPERHFVRRQTRDAWGNGEVECRAGRGESLPEECQAAVFLRVEPVIGRGLRVDLRGSCAMPVDLSLLRRHGYGSPELSKIRFREQKVVARIAWTFAGRVLGQTEEELEGAPLRQALVELCRAGEWQASLWQRWETFCFYETLSESLSGTSPARTRTPEDELTRRLETLGLETSEELELLDDADLEPDAEKVQEHETLKKTYPSLYHYGGVAYDVLYYPVRRLVVLRWLSGPRGSRPNANQLPRWNGWKVEVDERGRVTPLRS